MRSLERIRRRLAGERGAFAVLIAVLVVLMIIFVSLVVDLAVLRHDARADQRTADLSSIAGATALDPVFGGTARKGCEAAWSYFLANARDVTGSPSSPCGSFSSISYCDAFTPSKSVTTTVGAYTVTITTPVPDGSSLLQGRYDMDLDGFSCRRIAVDVSRSRGLFFSAVLGISSASTTRPAVARSTAGTSAGEAVPLIILDPTGCKSLNVSGQAVVQVKPYNDIAGIIQVDSDGTEQNAPQQERRCTGSADYAVDAYGTQNSRIEAGDAVINGNRIVGTIYIFALMPGNGTAHAYDPVDAANGRLLGAPTPGYRITRQPIDDRYNCSWANGCPVADTRPPYVDNLRASIGTTGAPPGFSTYPGTCKTTPGVPLITVPPGNWWVNCQNFDVASPIAFSGGNVVFQGNVTVGASGSLLINSLGINDAYAYFRRGSLIKAAQASIVMKRTMVYLDDGHIDLGAGSGALTWIAPTSGSFEDLALWSESSDMHLMGGQALLDIEGVFFTPNAYPFRFSGQGAQYQTKAQFVVYRMEVTGQGALVMQPDPERIVPVPILGVRLIR